MKPKFISLWEAERRRNMRMDEKSKENEEGNDDDE